MSKEKLSAMFSKVDKEFVFKLTHVVTMLGTWEAFCTYLYIFIF